MSHADSRSRMSRSDWALTAVAASVVMALGGLGYAISTQKPQRDGQVNVQGLAAPVTVERDAHGIPTIKAASERDAWMALGYVHAQDRLWQLTTHQHIGSGRLAELFGAGAVDTDRFLRAIGIRRAAQAQWEALDGESRQAVLAYAQGVNAYLAQPGVKLPVEFSVLGVKPGQWEGADTLAWLLIMSLDLGANWSQELDRMLLSLEMPQAKVGTLMPPYPGEPELLRRDLPSLYRELGLGVKETATSLAAARPVWPTGVEGIGSNNWVISGKRSETGKPLLANDPHLGITAPALWYYVRMEWPGQRVAGATMPGVPLVVLGQTPHLAWGFTNTNPDVQDLYIEQVDPADATRYRTPDGWASFTQFDETIKVRGGQDVPFKSRWTRHGPVLSDAATSRMKLALAATSQQGPRYVLSLRWTALEGGYDNLQAGLKMMRAKSVDEFVAATQTYGAPMQSMVVADREGHIGMVAPGRVPLRSAEDDIQGQAPAPGWLAQYDWAGYIPRDETPRVIDPAKGYVATANHRILDDAYPHPFKGIWDRPYRSRRIEQLIEARPKHSLDSLQQIQLDEVSLAARFWMPHLRKLKSAHPLHAAAMAELTRFEGDMGVESVGALLYTAWFQALREQVIAPHVGGRDRLASVYGGMSMRGALESIIERNDASWCDEPGTATVETCELQMNRAWTRTLERLNRELGSQVATWNWGRVHISQAEHRPFSRVPVLAGLFGIQRPVGGDGQTVNANNADGQFVSHHGPSLRALYDVANPDASRIIFSSGQSGWAGDPLSSQFATPWAEGRDVPLWRARARWTQVLQPQVPQQAK